MLNDFTGADQVYIACGYTDLRKGIDGLARLVQQQFELDPFTNTLFLFCGRRRDRIKGLYWEKDGFILLYKRLEQGAYQWPRSESEVKTLTPQQWPVSTGVVQTRRNQRIHLLPLGTGAVNCCRPSTVLRCAGRDLCGAAGTEENVSQRFGTLRHTAYWEGQSGHLPRL